MAQKIKSVKDLRKLPSGNYLDIKTRVVYAKAMIENDFADDFKNIATVQKPKAIKKSKARAKKKTVNKSKK